MDQPANEQPASDSGASSAFKPNIYPIIWWALAYGIAAGLLLFVLALLARFITLVWFPVFLAGLIWGALRNYRQQKRQYAKGAGVTVTPQSPLNEIKEAVRDIAQASRETFAKEAASAEAVAASRSEEAPPEPTEADPSQQEPPSPASRAP